MDIDRVIGVNGSSADEYFYDDLNVLVVYGDNASFTKTVEEHLNSFRQYLPFNVYYANGVLDYNNISWLDDFDVIIIHYSLTLYKENYMSKGVIEGIRKSEALKIVFAQDEYERTDELIRKVNDLGANFYFTSVPSSLQGQVFEGRLNPTVRLIYNLTGYVANYHKFLRHSAKDIDQRRYTVAYRGRPLHPRYGLYGYFKWNAGKVVDEYCKRNNIISNIAVSEEERLYWNSWHDLLRDTKAMLATPSGSNVFDFDGSIKNQLDKKYGQANFEKYLDILEELKPIERKFQDMGQISPKVFEMFAFGVVPLIIPARLIPEMKSNENYIEVSNDLDNLDEVFEKLEDKQLCEKIISKNYQILDSNKYSYKNFIESLEKLIRINVTEGKGIEFLTTAYAKKKTKINWHVQSANDQKSIRKQFSIARRNFETINYSILPRDSFTSSFQYHLDIWAYQEYLGVNPLELASEASDWQNKIGKPYRFLKHLFRHETHVFKTQMLSELEHNSFLHRRILAKIFLRMPKKVKEIIYKFFV